VDTRSTSNDSTPSQENSSTTFLEISDETLGTEEVDGVNTSVSPLVDLDYEIFPVKDCICCPPNEIRLPTQDGKAKSLIPVTVVQFNAGGKIWAATAATGPVAGDISPCPYIVKMPGWAKFQEVWSICLGRQNRAFGDPCVCERLLTCSSRSWRLRILGCGCRDCQTLRPYCRRATRDS
jgi:hypothetical protein